MSYLFNVLKAIILGIIQGITEWLPISSTAHLILVEDILSFGSDDFFNLFKVIIQLGSIMAVLVLFWRKLCPYKKIEGAEYGKEFIPNVKLFVRNVLNAKEIISMWHKIAVSCIPAAVIGYFLSDYVDNVLASNYVIAAALIIYGIAFLWLENARHKIKCDSIKNLSYKSALAIGFFQTLAMIPGTSRSGSTILGATILGTSREVAAEYSFFLAIPVMCGASGLKLVRSAGSVSLYEWSLIIVGTAVAFIVSLAAIRFFLNYIKKHSFVVFGWYRILLGIVILIITFCTKLLK